MGERLTGAGGQERLGEVGHAGPGHGADQVGDDRHLTPAEDGEALIGGEGFDACLRGVGFALFGGEEGGAHHVLAGGGQLEAGHGSEELVRDLHEEAGTVAGSLIGSDGAAVFEVAQGGESGIDDVVAGFAAEGGNDGQAAGVLLLLRVVEACGVGQCREAPERRECRRGLVRFGPAGAVQSLGHGRRPSS